MSLVGASGMDVAPGGKVYGCLQKSSREISILQTELLQVADCHRGKKQMPRETPLVLYINGNGGVLELMQETGVDVIVFDWTVGIADGSVGIQGNVDPGYLFSPLPALTDEIQRVLRCARTKPKVHIHNLPLVILKKLWPISLK